MRGKSVCSNCGLTIGDDGSCGCDIEDTGCPECLEQARLLGMSAERELALRSQVERLERENAKLRNIARLHYGYAKGFYMNKCIRCEQQMEFVDKRCYVCADCADKDIDADMKEKRHD